MQPDAPAAVAVEQPVVGDVVHVGPIDRFGRVAGLATSVAGEQLMLVQLFPGMEVMPVLPCALWLCRTANGRAICHFTNGAGGVT